MRKVEKIWLLFRVGGIFLLLLLSACDSKSNDRIRVKVLKDSIRVVSEFDSRELLDGFSLKIRKRGLQSYTSYYNGKKDGLRYTFYEDGSIKTSEKFFNGARVAINRSYYPNGRLEAAIFHDGKIRRNDSWHYFENGLLKQYSFYQYDGDLVFRQNFDRQGKFVEMDGRPHYFFYEDDSIKVGCSFSGEIALASPWFSSVNARYFLIDVEDGDTLLERVIEQNELRYEISIESPGMYTFFLESHLYDSLTGETKKFIDRALVSVD